jgi:hypothetical protein
MVPDPYRQYRPWFYAAAAYNFIWGTVVILAPNLLFQILGMELPNYPGIWQSVGMMVQVYAFGYWLLAKDPERYSGFIWIALLGKTFGPLGFLFTAINGGLPWAFGWTIVTNDLIWWPAFWSFALRHAKNPLGR